MWGVFIKIKRQREEKEKKGSLCIWPKRNCRISQKLQSVDGLLGREAPAFGGWQWPKASWIKGRCCRNLTGSRCYPLSMEMN